jgi:copper chaperone
MKLKVEGMTCGHCVKAVTKAVAGAPGVDRVVTVDLGRGEVVLEGAPDVALLTKALADEGYTARLVD